MARILIGKQLKTINGTTKTIDEWFCGQKPLLSDIHAFGCLAYAWIPKPIRKKFQDRYGTSISLRARPCIYLGPENNAHRLIDPTTNTMFQASTVLFNEKQFGISPFLMACSELGIDPGRAASMFNKPYTLEVPMEHQTNASSGWTIPMTPSFFLFDVQPSVDKPPDVMNPQDHDNPEDHHLEPSSSSSDPSSLPSSSGPSSHDESSLGSEIDSSADHNSLPVSPPGSPLEISPNSPLSSQESSSESSSEPSERTNLDHLMVINNQPTDVGRHSLRRRDTIALTLHEDFDYTSEPSSSDYGQAQAAMTEFEKRTPRSYRDATTSPDKGKWLQAMRDKHSRFKKYNAYTLVPPDHASRSKKECYIVRSVWKFRIKTQNGIIVKFKARLCADGAQMKQQIAARKLRLDNDLALTPDQCTAPTAEMLTTRMLFALAARLNLKVHSGDIPSAYLQAPITSDLYNIYLEQPAGMIVPGKEDWLMKLNSAVYGTLNAGHLWNNVYTEALISIGFKQSPHKPCLFILTEKDDFMIFKLNTDDNANISTCEALRLKVVTALMKKFGYTDKGICNHHLGITITQGDDAITLSQTAPILAIIEEFPDLANCDEPIQRYIPQPVTKQGEDKEKGKQRSRTYFKQRHGHALNEIIQQEGMFRSTLGKLRYITTTRPDIEFALNFICRYQDRPTAEHYTHVLDILGYLKKFPDLGLVNHVHKGSQRAPLELSAKVDKSFADCPET